MTPQLRDDVKAESVLNRFHATICLKEPIHRMNLISPHYLAVTLITFLPMRDGIGVMCGFGPLGHRSSGCHNRKFTLMSIAG